MTAHTKKVNIGKKKQRQIQAELRRSALEFAECSTYEIKSGSRKTSIVCLCCGSESFNRNDIENRYCGFCHEPHKERWGFNNN